jgi:hypothetical protein
MGAMHAAEGAAPPRSRTSGSVLTFPPAWPGLVAQRGLTSLFAGAPPQNAGDVPYDAAWGGTPKAHTKDPTPVSAENNSLGKKGAIASGESFEEYMKKRAAQGK